MLHTFQKECGIEICFLIQIGNHRDDPNLYLPIREAQLKLAEQEEGKLYLTEAEHSKSVEALNQLRDTYLKNGRYSDGIDSVLLKIMKSRYRPYRGRGR